MPLSATRGFRMHSHRIVFLIELQQQACEECGVSRKYTVPAVTQASRCLCYGSCWFQRHSSEFQRAHSSTRRWSRIAHRNSDRQSHLGISYIPQMQRANVSKTSTSSLPTRFPQQRRDSSKDDQQTISNPICRTRIPIFPITQQSTTQRPTNNTANTPARGQKARDQCRLCSRLFILHFLHYGGPAAGELAPKNAVDDCEGVERCDRCGEAPDETHGKHRANGC